MLRTSDDPSDHHNNIVHPPFSLCTNLQPKGGSPGNNKLLLVDDEPDVIVTFKKGLEASGFVVDAFDNPVSALSNFKPGIYSLLLLDVKMPHMNGFELYEKIRKMDSKVKACFITANEVYYESLREIFPTIDIDCYVKPIEIEDLVNHVKAELANK